MPNAGTHNSYVVAQYEQLLSSVAVPDVGTYSSYDNPMSGPGPTCIVAVPDAGTHNSYAGNTLVVTGHEGRSAQCWHA